MLSEPTDQLEEVNILIVDDHPVFRFGIRTLLSSEPGMHVVGEAQTGAEAVSKALALHPRVVLMDLNLPDMNGIEATRRIMREAPGVNVLVVTMFDDDSVFGAMRAGARGYLLKGAEGDETLRAIRAVANGEAIFSPTVAQRLIGFFSRPAGASHNEQFPELTDRERDILRLIAQGLTNQAIAERLVISPKTVRNQVSIILSKLQVADRAEAIVKARKAGMTENKLDEG
jgi:DNA-binding NarL/FixJ family response regulator